MKLTKHGASFDTLVRRIRYGGRKGRSARRRLWPWAPWDGKGSFWRSGDRG